MKGAVLWRVLLSWRCRRQSHLPAAGCAVLLAYSTVSVASPFRMPLLVSERAPREPPARAPDGTLVFRDRADFRPNLTPAEVLQVRVAHAPARARRAPVLARAHTLIVL